MANGVAYNSFGSAQGEGFYAHDTLIASITVWRKANVYTNIGLVLYVNPMLSLNDSMYVPVTRPIMFAAPALVANDAPADTPIEMRWTFDPPLVLPSRGEYVMWFQTAGCNPVDYPLLYYTGGDAYIEGEPWYTNRSLTECVHLPNTKCGGTKTADMCFAITFCRNEVTRVRRGGWGALKMLYR